RHVVVRQGDGGCGGAVVDPVDAVGADGQGPGGDVRRGRGGAVGRVVAGVGAAEADPGHRHGLAGAHVLVVEGGRGVGVGEHVTRSVERRGGGGGGVGVVV